MRFSSSLYICIAALVSIWFALQTTSYLTDAAIDNDGAQNARIAYHLVHTGVWGYDDIPTPNPKPTMRREPLPILAIAALLLLHPSFAEPYNILDLTNGRLTNTIKLVNVFWRFLAALFIFLLCRELFSSLVLASAAALVCLLVSDMVFFSIGAFVDRLYTELPATALLLAASWCAVRFVRSETKSRAIYLGIAIGLLALTKAAFFYVGIVFLLLLFFLDRMRITRHGAGQSLRQLRISYVVIVAAFLATLTPWVMRNTIALGKFGIASRAEHVLGLRMLLVEQPLMGLVYASIPAPLKLHLGPILGYSHADLKVGGKLEGITFVKKLRPDIYAKRMEAEGYKGNARAWLRRSIILSVFQHPPRYLMSVGVFAYRGMWFMRPSGLAAQQLEPIIFYALSAASVLCFLAVFFGGLLARNSVLVAAFGLGAGAFFFHAALSHALPRYNAPLTPLVVIAVLWLLLAVWRSLLRIREPSGASLDKASV